MEKGLIKKVEKYVYNNPWNTSAFIGSAYFTHVEAVRKYALKLASKLNADKTVVETAALLHDIGKVKNLENHHIESAKIAEELLKSYNCDKKFIEDVVHCILVHRASEKERANIIEAQIIKDADGIAFIDLNTGGWLAFLYHIWIDKKSNFKDGLKETRNKIQRMYEKIETGYGKELAKPSYDKIMEILSFLDK